MRLRGLSQGFLQAASGAAATLAFLSPAFAGDGQPVNWQLGFQDAATPIAEQMNGFHNLLLVIIAAIVALVLGLLVWVVIRYNASANPTPSRNSHNTVLEIAWTIVPVLILLVIAIPSFRLLYAQYDFPKADLTIKTSGKQWYWSYTYPDQGGFSFDSIMVEDSDLKPGQPRLLAVDNEVVVPANKVVHVLVTADDVLHNWAIPAFGLKMDAVPGRVARIWFQAREPGVYYGQCSELCGERHAYMPIAVRVVTDAEFAAWVESAKQRFAGNSNAGPKIRAAGSQDNQGRAAAKLAAAGAQ